MPKAATDTITEIDYNGLQDDINTIMGTPAGNTESTATGYNQSLSSAQVAVNTSITASQWDNLRTDITKAYTHQFGSAPTITNVSTSTKITAAIFNQYETLVTTISGDPNRYTVDVGETSLITGQTATLSTGWNGTRDHKFTATFASSNERKAFFNAGGEIRFNLTLAYTGSEAKTLDWQTMMSDIGTVKFNYLNTRFSSASTNAIGNYDLTASFQNIATEDGASPYTENDIEIKAKENSATQIEFTIRLRDDDEGDQQLPGSNPGNDGVIIPGPAVDENVKGTTTSTVTLLKPNGSNVSVPAPTIAAAAGNQFTVT